MDLLGYSSSTPSKKFFPIIAHDGATTNRKILTMIESSSEVINGIYGLTNLLLKVWQAVIDLLNDKKPNFMSGPRLDGDLKPMFQMIFKQFLKF